MNDLVSMLEANNFGAELSSQLVNCLLCADDVVLIGKSEAELHRLLDITANFASKWNLKFNQNKSKVMIIGKRLDKDKKWQLGILLLEEANEYKYLGVYFTRSLTFAYHINCYLKDNFERKLNYMTKLLNEHGSFNRISFGDALWNSVIRPSIAC